MFFTVAHKETTSKSTLKVEPTVLDLLVSMNILPGPELCVAVDWTLHQPFILMDLYWFWSSIQKIKRRMQRDSLELIGLLIDVSILPLVWIFLVIFYSGMQIIFLTGSNKLLNSFNYNINLFDINK